MDVRVDSGPQDGTVLVTWIPVTLNITSAKEGRPITFRVKHLYIPIRLYLRQMQQTVFSLA